MLTSTAGVTYTYDGASRRVEKSNGKLYWYNTSGEVLEETDLSGNLISDYVFFSGVRVARRDASGSVYYYFADHLRSARVMTDSTGHIQQESDYYPFGGERVITNTVDNRYKFTGKERDAESGLDHSLYRKYSPTLGRWLSADPLAGKVANPQSLNRYAYVTGRPCSLTDPLGLFAPGPCIDQTAPGCTEGWFDEFFLQSVFGFGLESFFPPMFFHPGTNRGGPSAPAAVLKARSAAVKDIRDKKDCAALFGGAGAADKLARVTLAGADLGAPDVTSTPNGYKWDYQMARAFPSNNTILYNTNSNGFLDPQDITGYLNGNKSQPVTLDALESFNDNPSGLDASKILGRPATAAEFQTFLMLHEYSHFLGKPNSNDFDREIVSKCLK